MSTNRTWLIVLVLCLAFGFLIYSSHGEHIGDAKQEWGYIEVRNGAHIFWWLYYTTDNVARPQERPLIIWLQGGPGIAASCYGNFFEIGPLNITMGKRNETWTKHFNVLFVDYPTNVGFSYKSNNLTKLPKTVKEVGDDLISFTRKFFKYFGEFENTSLYVFGQSYGAKFAVELAVRLHMENKLNGMDIKVKGVGFFGGYISPIDFINNYGKVGLILGMFDDRTYTKVELSVRKIKSAINRRKYKRAQSLEKNLVMSVVDGFDIHNIYEPILHIYDNQFKTKRICEKVVENIVGPHLQLNQTVKWRYFNTDCYGLLENELLEAVTDKVEYLLNNTQIKVLVLSGMFDYIVNVAGTMDWVRNLKWNGTKEWRRQEQTIFPIDDINEAFVKRTDRLAVYIVLRAGHSIPMDNPKAVLEILRKEILQL